MKTYTTKDKSGWGDGPWQSEPQCQALAAQLVAYRELESE